MMTLDEITVEERITYLEKRLADLEEFLTEVADDFLNRFGVGKGDDDDTAL
jgi:hypothetical protein